MAAIIVFIATILINLSIFIVAYCRYKKRK